MAQGRLPCRCSRSSPASTPILEFLIALVVIGFVYVVLTWVWTHAPYVPPPAKPFGKFVIVAFIAILLLNLVLPLAGGPVLFRWR